PGEAREVDLPEGLLDQFLLGRLVERTTGHPLGGQDCQVGDLLADLVEEALREVDFSSLSGESRNN
ncbi:MAG: hypothetical protein ACKOFX_08480, partial [Solirubrobacterales bacterium]